MTVRVLVVDDSPTMRAMVSLILSRDPAISVVGAAATAQEAREMIKALSPDVITLDIEMPGMDGLDFLDRIMRLRPMPVVMLSTLTRAGAEATLEALELGAFDCLAKPTDAASATALRAELVETVKAAGNARRGGRRVVAATPPPAAYVPRTDAIIAVGASTGGVEALIQLLSGFPENCPPTVIVQHMPANFTASFAARLDRLARPKVCEAQSGAPLRPGHVYLAPGGEQHLEVVGRAALRCRLVLGERVNGHRPSVDKLFHSIAQTAGASAVGAILTGMGGDGAEGLKAMRDAGSMTFGQDEQSSLIYGMPQVAQQIGAVVAQLPLTRIAGRLLQECRA